MWYSYGCVTAAFCFERSLVNGTFDPVFIFFFSSVRVFLLAFIVVMAVVLAIVDIFSILFVYVVLHVVVIVVLVATAVVVMVTHFAKYGP